MTEYFFPLTDRREIADGTMAFFFDTREADFSFTAGQYATFTLMNPRLTGGQALQTDAEGNSRDISIASAPHEGREHIMIALRMRDTAFKNSLKTMPLGTKVKVSKPMGSFTLHKNAVKPAVFIASGIGITPMRSMIASAIHEKLSHRLYLFYSNRTPEATAFLADFEAWQKANPNFKFIPAITDEKNHSNILENVGMWEYEHGRIDKAMIKKYVPDPQNAVCYIAGPPAMVSGMLPVASNIFDPDNIRTEEFAGY